MKRLAKVFGVSGSLAVALLMAAPARAELVLAVNEGVTYYVTPSEIREKYKELADLIGKQLHTTVKVVPVDQYPVLRKGLDEQQYDVAFVHPAHHSLMSMRGRQVPPGRAHQGLHGVQSQVLREKGPAPEPS